MTTEPDVMAIIGTAGRKTDAQYLDRTVYFQMVDMGRQLIDERRPDAVISGGSAWADHVAVTLAIEYTLPITLFVPCAYTGAQYADTGRIDYITNPGGTLNYYHRRFQMFSGVPSFDDLARCRDSFTIVPGMMLRNNAVAVADACTRAYAFTFGETELKDGGTKHTCTRILKLQKPLFHCSLHPAAERVWRQVNSQGCF